MSSMEVTPERQRAQASCAAFGMWVPGGTRAERTSSCVGTWGRSMTWDTVLLKVGWHLEQQSLGPGWADVKGAIREPLFRDVAVK